MGTTLGYRGYVMTKSVCPFDGWSLLLQHALCDFGLGNAGA